MKYDKKKIIITGSSGFLGRNLINYLTNRDEYYIYALSSKGKKIEESNKFNNILYLDKNVIYEEEKCKNIINNGIIINCAFPRNSSGREMADGLDYIQHLFLCAKKYLAKGIINISSQSVYSTKRKKAATEDTELCLETSYAVGKYAIELMLKSICDNTNLFFTNVRIASLIGPNFDQRIVNRFIKQAINMESITVCKSKQEFGFLDVEDAVKGIINLLEIDFSVWKEVYNLGNARGYTIEEILTCIKAVFESLKRPFPKIIIQEGNGEGTTAVEFQLLYNDTGYIPSIDLEKSVRKIIKASRNSEN